MNDKTHIGFIDAHSECNGRHDNIRFLIEEVVLVLDSNIGIKTCVVGCSFEPVNVEQFRDLFNFFAAQAIDDT